MYSKPKNEVVYEKETNGVKGKGSKKKFIDPGNLLFVTMIFGIFVSTMVTLFKSKDYIKYLREQNPSYYHPSFFDICIKTAALTIALLIPKVLLEKALFPFTEKILVEKYFTNEHKHEKIKAQKKMAIYGVKLFHYLFITIHSYYVYDKFDFFPRELFGHGDMKKLYYRGLKSFAFFEKPRFFELHYLINLAYTFADLICVVFIYDGQTDILVMIFHHFCTIILLGSSIFNHFDSIGAIILFLHNLSDILVYFARTFLYIVTPEWFKKVGTACLFFTFIYCRLYVYGKLIYDFFQYTTWKSFGIIETFKFNLTSLYILHCVWSYKLIRIMIVGLTKGKFNDSREFIKEKKN